MSSHQECCASGRSCLTTYVLRLGANLSDRNTLCACQFWPLGFLAVQSCSNLAEPILHLAVGTDATFSPVSLHRLRSDQV
jgi:hypothetical protein